jgi:hypothetical protein
MFLRTKHAIIAGRYTNIATSDVRSDNRLRVSQRALRFSMKQNRYEEGKFSCQGRGLGTVTEAMVQRRARELALINGRGEDQVLDSDLERARHELTEGPIGLEEDETPESKRWDPVPGTEPTSPTVVPAPDEQTFAEKLVKEGVRDAEHERMVDATRESLKRDREDGGE